MRIFADGVVKHNEIPQYGTAYTTLNKFTSNEVQYTLWSIVLKI